MEEVLNQDIQLCERGINELKMVSNMADDFFVLAQLCSQSAHLGGSCSLSHIQSLIVSYVDLAVSMDALAETIDMKLELK